MRSKRTRRVDPAVPMVAMADIAFLLIIFFMLTTTFMQDKGMAVLPKARSAKPLPERQVSIVITEKSEIFLNDQPVSLESLPAVLERALAETALQEVVIRGDYRVALGTVVKVMDIVRETGASIAIAAQDKT